MCSKSEYWPTSYVLLTLYEFDKFMTCSLSLSQPQKLAHDTYEQLKLSPDDQFLRQDPENINTKYKYIECKENAKNCNATKTTKETLKGALTTWCTALHKTFLKRDLIRFIKTIKIVRVNDGKFSTHNVKTFVVEV